MAATVAYLIGTQYEVINGKAQNGKAWTQSVYFAASAAAGTLCPASLDGDADANSEKDFVVPSGMIVTITDGIVAAASGVLRLFKDGQPTQVLLVSAAQQAANVRSNLNIQLGPGKYNWKVQTALPA